MPGGWVHYIKERLETMSKYFGTDGFRGKANVGLTVEHTFEVVRFLGWNYGRPR